MHTLGSNPARVSLAAKSPCVAMTDLSATEGSPLYAAVIAIKSRHDLSTTSCHIGPNPTLKTMNSTKHIGKQCVVTC
jgi:hypothetical protein